MKNVRIYRLMVMDEPFQTKMLASTYVQMLIRSGPKSLLSFSALHLWVIFGELYLAFQP